MRFLQLALIVTVLWAPAVLAQESRPRAFDTIRSSESYRQAVLGTYQDYESSLSAHCPKIEINMNTSQAKVYGEIQTNANGDIVNAHWKEMTDGVACGEKRSYTASVTILNGKPAVAPLFPGQSAAGPVLAA